MIAFLDLKKINQPYEVDFENKLKQVLQSGWYILGDEVKKFESDFATYCKAKHCIGVGNGLDALILVLKGHIELGQLEKGDEVIVPANTYIASILAIIQAGLIPVLVEPSLERYTINPDLITKKITKKTRAILVVHLYGQLAEMDRINSIAFHNNLLVIEDAAQAHGAISNDQFSQNTKAYSFYPGKNLGALGDGGAITTNNEELANVLFSLRNYGSQTKYYNDHMGINSRLDELQAAFLNLKLPHLDADNAHRRNLALKYVQEITNPKITLPFWDFSANHVFHLFVVRTANRNQLQAYLQEEGIQTGIHYPVAPHRQKAFAMWHKTSFPITEKIHTECLSLPISPVMTIEEADFVIRKVNAY